MILGIVVITIVVAIAGTIMIRAVVVAVVVIEVSPAAIADIHPDRVVFRGVVPGFILFFVIVIILVPVFRSYRRIINIIGGLPAFIRSGTTGECGYRKENE